MLTDKQLLFVLGEIHSIQKKNIGIAGISVMTGYETNNFVVTIEFNFKKEKDNISSEYKEFLFEDTMTEDQCVDNLSDIEKLIKKEIEKNEKK